MARRFNEKQLIIASHNPGKVREINDLLHPFGIMVRSASELSLEEPEETGDTFVTNAILKAEAAAHATQLPALADDSGLVVEALGGDPGIYSARWAGPGKEFTVAMEKIETLLKPESVRTAKFVCALALAWPDGHVETFEGLVKGDLVWPPRGLLGFGYDPMFLPNGRVETFGEMDQVEKHTISHRADAFGKLVAACFH
jgi:XTP/dITP diphosphohydrolase